VKEKWIKGILSVSVGHGNIEKLLDEHYKRVMVDIIRENTLPGSNIVVLFDDNPKLLSALSSYGVVVNDVEVFNEVMEELSRELGIKKAQLHLLINGQGTVKLVSKQKATKTLEGGLSIQSIGVKHDLSKDEDISAMQNIDASTIRKTIVQYYIRKLVEKSRRQPIVLVVTGNIPGEILEKLQDPGLAEVENLLIVIPGGYRKSEILLRLRSLSTYRKPFWSESASSGVKMFIEKFIQSLLKEKGIMRVKRLEPFLYYLKFIENYRLSTYIARRIALLDSTLYAVTTITYGVLLKSFRRIFDEARSKGIDENTLKHHLKTMNPKIENLVKRALLKALTEEIRAYQDKSSIAQPVVHDSIITYITRRSKVVQGELYLILDVILNAMKGKAGDTARTTHTLTATGNALNASGTKVILLNVAELVTKLNPYRLHRVLLAMEELGIIKLGYSKHSRQYWYVTVLRPYLLEKLREALELHDTSKIQFLREPYKLERKSVNEADYEYLHSQ
jgi:hypothetical protein